MKNKVIIFDCDGTLVDTFLLIEKTVFQTFETLLPDYPLTKDEAHQFFGPFLNDSFKKYVKTDKEVKQLVECYRCINDEFMPYYIKAYDGIKEILESLKKKDYTLAFVSNKVTPAVLKGLKLCQINDYFDLIIGAEQLKEAKPNPEGIYQVLKKYPSDEVFMIGDTIIDIETGKTKKEKKKDYSKIFGEKLVELAKKDERIVAITASMKDGTGLTKFAKEYPTRFFDIGIAEQHALTMAAGMAKEGMIPFVPIYSSFYQRAYDQVIHDIAMQNLPVIMCVDRAGIIGADGETHQGTLDMAFFRLVPNLTIMAPKDFKELEKMMEFAIKLNKPVVIRYPRGGEDENVKFEKHTNIELGKAEILKEGQDVSIIAIGKKVADAMKIAEQFEEEGIKAEVINARFLKPLDEETIKKSIEKTKNVITIEDGTKINGLGTAIEELIVENHLQNVKFEKQAWPDEFLKQCTEWKWPQKNKQN